MPKEKKGRTHGNGEGRIRRNASGTYTAEIMVGWKYVKGKRKRDMRQKTFDTRPEAVKWCKGAKDEPAAHDAKMQLKDWADQWYSIFRAEVDKRKIEESTYANYAHTLKLIKAQWGDYSMSEITALIIENGMDEMVNPRTGKRYSMSTYKKVKAMLHQIFNRAEVYGIIERGRSPMPLVKDLRNPERAEKKTDAYSLADIRIILNDAPDTLFGHALIVEMLGGYRRQEMLALRADDIDFTPKIVYEMDGPDGRIIVEDANKVDLSKENVVMIEIPQCRINIDKAIKLMDGKMYEGMTKSAAGDRLSHLPAAAWPHAKWLRDHAVNGYVFYSAKTGTCLYPKTYSDGITEALDMIHDVRTMNGHCLRHTFAKLYKATAGVAPEIIMAQGGWSDGKMMDHYADHTHDNEKRSAAALVNSILTGSIDVPKKPE